MRKGQSKFTHRFDTDFRFVIAHNPMMFAWADALRDYWATNLQSQTEFAAKRYSTGLTRFAIGYLDGLGLGHLSPEEFCTVGQVLPPLSTSAGLGELRDGARQHDVVVDFLDWLLRERLSVVDAEGHWVIPSNLALPFRRSVPKVHGKQDDLEFSYVLKTDPKLEDWRALAAEWMKMQTAGLSLRRDAAERFLLTYIYGCNLDRNFGRFLLRETPKPNLFEVLLSSRSKSNVSNSQQAREVLINNSAAEFIDWVLRSRFGDEDGAWDRTRFHNPVQKVSRKGMASEPSESNKAVLSIRYIKECRELLAEGPSFGDWKWAQGAVLGSGKNGDWFVVESDRLDRSDPDCVWRERPTSRYERLSNGYPETVTELWSPVRAAALYVKLELPLRTIQVRLLDSGEADTYRYDYESTQDGPHFTFNRGPHATGDAKRPYMRGVFHRSGSELNAGLYINTNKTADIDKSERQKGYVIPWAHPQVLYWLSKLRDWQAKYNPLISPTPWTELKRVHFGNIPPHASIMAQRGTACFLFRDPCSRQACLPICNEHVDLLWHRLLGRLEARCAARGDTLDSGEPLAFVLEGGEASHFPLHSLRVSLISYLVLDLNLPLPVVSKLIAGHSTIIMTLYYTKFGHAKMSEVLEEADRRALEADQQNHRRFLKNATYEDVRNRFASICDDAFRAVVGISGAGLVFDDKGICPVGGSRCDIGAVRDEGNRQFFVPVPGFPRERNCVRCRFFLTGPAFLPALQAHFNAVSARLKIASSHWNELQQQLRHLEQERNDCEQLNRPFVKALEIERVDQRNQEAEEACSRSLNDLQATYYLIERCNEILARMEDSDGVKLVAGGTLSDITTGFIESASELHQLEVVCENAVIYTNPEASPAILRRAQLLDRMLIFNRMPPVLMHMDEKTQLQVGNAMMQLIRARTGSIQNSLPYAECQKRLSELGIEPRDLEAEMKRIVGEVQVRQLRRIAKSAGARSNSSEEQD